MRNRVIGSIVVLGFVVAAAFSWVAIGMTATSPSGSTSPQIVIQPVTPNPNAGRAPAQRKPPPPGPPPRQQ